VTEAEVRELLNVCGEYDGTEYGEPAVVFWAEALDCRWLPNLAYDEALAAVLEHYQATPVRVKPGDVLRRVRDDRLVAVQPGGRMPRYGVPPNDEYRAAREALERRIETRRRAERGGV
jgi:hypothetical protein